MMATTDRGKQGQAIGIWMSPIAAAGPAGTEAGKSPRSCPMMTGCAGCPWAGAREAGDFRPARRKRSRLRAFLLFTLALALFAFYVVNGPGPRLYARAKRLAELSVSMEKPMGVTINGDFAASATFDHSFSVPLDAEVPVRLPVKSVLKVPIFESFQVGLDKPFAVSMSEPLHLEENIRVKGDMPVDTVVEAKVLGVTAKVPIRGVIPVNFVFPLKQDIRLPESLSLTIVKPLAVEIQKVVEAPIDFVVEGKLPLRQDIRVPLKEAIPCRVKIDQELPLTARLNLGLSDWGQGLKLDGMEN